MFRVLLYKKILYKSVTINFLVVTGENKIISMQQFRKICDQDSSQHCIINIVFVLFLFRFLRPKRAADEVTQISTSV